MPRPLRITVEIEPEQYKVLIENKEKTGTTLVFQIREAIKNYTKS